MMMAMEAVATTASVLLLCCSDDGDDCHYCTQITNIEC